jgi:hypothetical protein
MLPTQEEMGKNKKRNGKKQKKQQRLMLDTLG